MHVAENYAEGDRAAQIEHSLVRLCGRRHVIKHQQNARDRKNHEQEEADQAQSHRVCGAQRLPTDAHWLNVQKEIREAGCCTAAVRRWQRVAKDGAGHVVRQLHQAFAHGVLLSLIRSGSFPSEFRCLYPLRARRSE